MFTHTCKRKKENPRPLRPHSLAAESSATLHLINFYRGGHPKLDGAVVGGRRSRSQRHGISPLPLSAAYLHRHSRLWSTGVFCGIGLRIFLMEKVINLEKHSLISYRNPSVVVNQPTEISGIIFVLADSWVFIHVSTVRAQIRQVWSWPVGNEVLSHHSG